MRKSCGRSWVSGLMPTANPRALPSLLPVSLSQFCLPSRQFPVLSDPGFLSFCKSAVVYCLSLYYFVYWFVFSRGLLRSSEV